MPYTNTNPSLPYASGSDTSRDAAIRATKFVGEQGMEVLAWFRQRGAYGGTQKEACAALGIERPSMCARCNALEESKALIKSKTERRGGCAVYYINEV